MTIYDVLKRPIITEKALTMKEEHRTLTFEVDPKANKIQIKAAVQALFRVQVDKVRTANVAGKFKRRGKFTGYTADWKKAYVKLKAGEKVPEYAEV